MKRKKYNANIIAFDIETTGLTDRKESFMYIWQFYDMTENSLALGRTWREFVNVINTYKARQGNYVVWVHNLGYEFQFIKNLFDWEEVFATDIHKIVRATTGNIEFRDSYILSGQSLKQFLKNCRVEHQKIDGNEFNYDKVRYADSKLSELELEYCKNDVIGLCEAIEHTLRINNDTLETIPMTKTGYVRRMARKALQDDWTVVKRNKLTYDQYLLCKDCFRGGDTHSNFFYNGEVINNVKSYDRSSSYPDVMVNCKFPMSEFKDLKDKDPANYNALAMSGKYALMARITFFNLRVKDPMEPAPYIPIAKSWSDNGHELVIPMNDNGRVREADAIQVAITDIDYLIIKNMYHWDNMIIDECYYSKYDYLPQAFRDLVIDLYKQKTELKGIIEKLDQYGLAKGNINSMYGMLVQDPYKENLVFTNGNIELIMDCEEDDYDEHKKALVEKSQKSGFVNYQWGVWVSAWARLRLHEAFACVKNRHNIIYWDTDSVKFIGEADFEEYNNDRMRDSIKNGAFATDPKGKTHYMGVLEFEEEYEQFKTFGAKRYAGVYEISEKDYDYYVNEVHYNNVFRENDKPKILEITIAGVNKIKGAEELLDNGGLVEWRENFLFNNAKKVSAHYNERDYFIEEIDGHIVEWTSNVYLEESTYKMTMAQSYVDTINKLRDGFTISTNIARSLPNTLYELGVRIK